MAANAPRSRLKASVPVLPLVLAVAVAHLELLAHPEQALAVLVVEALLAPLALQLPVQQ